MVDLAISVEKRFYRRSLSVQGFCAALKCEQVPRIPPDFAAQTSPAPEVATVCAPGDWEGLPDGEADSQAARELLKKIHTAISRIDSGEYGWCLETGEPIGLPRLLARPTAEYSIEAQERHEKMEKLRA